MNRIARLNQRFARDVDAFSGCCRRSEQAYALGALRARDVELVYSSSFLSVCVRWESFLIDCLVECACDRSGRSVLMSPRSRQHMWRLLKYPQRDFVSMPSLKSAVERAELFLHKRGLPFSSISEPNQTKLEHARLTRNAIAHHSEYALRSFRRKVSGVEALAKNQRFPGPFLRHRFRRNPDQKRWEMFFVVFRASAMEVESSW